MSLVFNFGLEMGTYSVLERDESVTVCVVVRSASVPEVFTATLFTRDVTAQGMHVL